MCIRRDIEPGCGRGVAMTQPWSSIESIEDPSHPMTLHGPRNRIFLSYRTIDGISLSVIVETIFIIGTASTVGAPTRRLGETGLQRATRLNAQRAARAEKNPGRRLRG